MYSTKGILKFLPDALRAPGGEGGLFPFAFQRKSLYFTKGVFIFPRRASRAGGGCFPLRFKGNLPGTVEGWWVADSGEWQSRGIGRVAGMAESWDWQCRGNGRVVKIAKSWSRGPWWEVAEEVSGVRYQWGAVSRRKWWSLRATESLSQGGSRKWWSLRDGFASPPPP